ncbi:MAG TPA: Spy/CpxP family protein refolding chaperone [Pyrinomonadaceae bacterium]|nr:Spy/CpxP family protein refolding chaperone [Pyrinomonadaceae bacterium]
MKDFINNLFKSIVPALLLLTTSAVSTMAQGGVVQQGEPVQLPAQQQQQDGDLLRQLNLTPEQVERIRSIQQQSRDERRLAGERLREAQRALDEAIYRDNVDETLVEQRTRELAVAQADAARLRATTELRIRRVLTPEQIITFRMIRQRAQQVRREERRMEGMRPAQQLRRERLERRQGGQVQGNTNTGQQQNALPARERPGRLLRRP